MRSKGREYIWFLIEFTNGKKEWYCVSRVLRQSLFLEKKVNQFWKNTMIGNYITVSTRKYVRDQTQLTVGKITKIKILYHGSRENHWTRNQFVTPEHLMNFYDSYNYLKHDYAWYNRFSIWIALKYWHNELLRRKIVNHQKKIKSLRWNIRHFGKINCKK